MRNIEAGRSVLGIGLGLVAFAAVLVIVHLISILCALAVMPA